MSKWIKIEEQLPEENQKCMVKVKYTFKDRKPSIDIYSDIYKSKSPFWTGEMIDSRVTYWKPINSKTCVGCVHDKENCMCTNECVKDEKGWLSEYKNIVTEQGDK